MGKLEALRFQSQAAEEDAQEQESDEEDTNEAKMNTLRRQLEDCRSELFEVYDQVSLPKSSLLILATCIENDILNLELSCK